MWSYNYSDELCHVGIFGMKLGANRVSKRTYSDKEISDYCKRKMSEAPSKVESPSGANKGWYKNAPKATLIRRMRQEDKDIDRKKIKETKKLNSLKKQAAKTKKGFKQASAMYGHLGKKWAKTGEKLNTLSYKDAKNLYRETNK